MLLRLLGTALFAGFLVFIGALLPAALAMAAAMPQEEPGAGELMLSSGQGLARRALQLDASVHFQLSGLVAHVQLEQTFRNDSADWVEGEYMFPLPDNAAVNRLRLVVGERVIIGEIKEKQAARKIYQAAQRSGRKASLVEQRRPNMFSNKVANIGPGETVTVALSYIQRISYRDGQFSLRFPMTITPRYSPLGSSDADQVWQFLHPQPATPAEPVQSIRITAELDMGLPLASIDAPYHSLALTRQRQTYRLALAEGTVPMHRDFVLQWRPQSGSEPQAAVFHERVGAEEYALLMVLPPAADADASEPLPRELIFVIDTSGSMGGSSISQARASLDFALQQLRPVDSFNVIAFNNSASALFAAAEDANAHNLARAREFVRHLAAGGGTEMLSALQLALPAPPTPLGSDPSGVRPQKGHMSDVATRVRQVVFITDGAVGNETQLFQEIQRRLGKSRLFTVGIGSAPNSWFMRKAAEAGGGDFTFIGDVLEVQQQMQQLFDRLSQTLLADFQVDWPTTVETYPAQIPDLYPGQPLVISARSDASLLDSPVTISGRSAGKPWRRTLAISSPSAADARGHEGVSTIWARAKIASLLDQKALGANADITRAAVLPLALQHQLVSPYTSFVAVEQRPSRPAASALGKQAVPNLRPKGQSPQVYAYPRTASPARLQLLYGLILLVTACVFYRFHYWSWR
ncbi:MAG: marine proteobacterial sortase target protein [Halieaceae bacterium]